LPAPHALLGTLRRSRWERRRGDHYPRVQGAYRVRESVRAWTSRLSIPQQQREPLLQGSRSVPRTRLNDPLTGISRRATVKPWSRCREALAARACFTCGPCSARRHWQQAASNDARAGPAFRRDNVPPCDGANTGPRSLARVRCSQRVKDLRAVRASAHRRRSGRGDAARVLMHREL
jgi:hypothetical protein